MKYYAARWIFPVEAPPIEYGFIGVSEGRVAAVGALSELAPSEKTAADLSTVAQTVMTPGWVNTHTHLELSFDTPVSMNAGDAMGDWLLRVVERGRDESSLEDKSARCERGIREVLASGTTCVNDISSGGESLEKLAQAGLRGIVSLEFFHPGHDEIHLEPLIERYDRLRSHPALKGSSPLLSLGLSPHSPYNVSPRAWRYALEACRPQTVHTHLGESLDEMAWLAGEDNRLDALHQAVLGKTFRPQLQGKSPVSYLEAFDLLTPGLVAAHGVQVKSAQERNLLKARDVRLAHCPRSNLFLLGETLNIRQWLDSGVPLGLGTDSRLSNATLNLRSEARYWIEQGALFPVEALRLLTLEGARVLSLADRVGSLAPGKEADFVLWETAASLENEPEAQQAVFLDETTAARVFVRGNQVFTASTKVFNTL